MTERTYRPGDIYRHHELHECHHPCSDAAIPHTHYIAGWEVCDCPVRFVAPAPLPFGPDGEPGDVVWVDGELFERREGGSWAGNEVTFGDWQELTGHAIVWRLQIQRYTKAESYIVTDEGVTRDE